ncbi:MAG: hypothetical protein J0L84_13665 [Verrucomicrobia bacterium]|nr:hypothetical protein [Verrucomicrobiota bacterium]
MHLAPWIALAALTWLLAAAGLNAWQSTRAAAVTRRHAEAIAADRVTQARERADRELGALEEIRRQASRHQTEFVQAAGGELAAALCDPGVDLAQALRLIAESCVPPRAAVQVRVERFTEFEVTVHLATAPAPGELVRVSRCLLTETSGLVHSLRFLEGGRLVGHWDRRRIESIPDWPAATEDQISAALDTDAVTPTNTAQAARSGERPGPEDTASVPEDSPLHMVLRAFDEDQNRRIREINGLAQELIGLAALGTMSGVPEIESRLGRTRDLAASIASERTAWVDPFPELMRQLLDAGVDSVLARVAVRELRQKSQASRMAAGKVFTALNDLVPPLERFLSVARDHWGHWAVEDGGMIVRFDSPETQQAFNTVQSRLERATLAEQSAVDSWNRANAAAP